MKIKKESIGNLIKVIVFLTLLFILFLCFTYLFRNTDRSTRGTVVEYYKERENSLDVVFIGASNVNTYWNPMRAWDEYGIATRNYAPTGMSGDVYLAAIQSALRTQEPKLVVLEARAFVKSHEKGVVDVGARRFLDSLDYDLFRMKLIRDYSETMKISWENALSLYVDLIQYHSNYKALINPRNWSLADNRESEEKNDENMYKGYLIFSRQVEFKDPSRYLSSENGEIEETSLKLYTDIIEYCKENDIPLMIMASPIVVNKTRAEKFNTLESIAEIYGVEFLDTNKLYDEIGIDFAQDFFNSTHVNILGADKFTDYFAKYLVENYDLPDHRGEDAYVSWDELYEEYIVVSDEAREVVREKIAINQAALKIEADMKVCEDPAEWLKMANNSEITLLMAAKELPDGVPSAESLEMLSSVGITDEYFAGDGALKIVYNAKVKYSDFSVTERNGVIGEQNTKYIIKLGDIPQILIGKENYFDASKDGIHIVAFDNNTEDIFDIVCLNLASDGSLIMER